MKNKNTLVFTLVCLLLASCFDQKSVSQTIADSSISLQKVFTGVKPQQPVALLQAPHDNGNWYIVEKQGRVIRTDEQGKSRVYLDITDRVDAGYNESGLLGVAFHPDFNKNGEIYVSYTANGSPLTSVISRFKATSGNLPDPNSEQVMLRVDQPYSNHNGGLIAFDPQGYLMIGLGDGGSGGDPKGHGQNTQTLLGAMLRIDVNSKSKYSIPPGNPFVDKSEGKPEIYAWGLRNPWRWSFDRNTGELWVADVGQNEWEEVNLMAKPGNYGWNIREGTHCFNSSKCKNPLLIDPVAEYSHDFGCSITGGYVYRGKDISSLQGVYLYGDFCSGLVWGLFRKANGGFDSKIILKTNLMISSFAQDNQGEIYVIHYDGEIYKIVSNKQNP